MYVLYANQILLKKWIRICQHKQKICNKDTPDKEEHENTIQGRYDSVTFTSTESAQSDKDNEMNAANNQETNVSNTDKSSSSEVFKNDENIEASNNILTTEN